MSTLDTFYDDFESLNDAWGWPADEESNSPECQTHRLYLGTPWQGLTDCLMRSLYKCRNKKCRGAPFLLDTLERPLSIASGILSQSRLCKYRTYLHEIGPFFIEHRMKLEKAQRHLEKCPPSALKIGFLTQVKWQLYIAACVSSDARGLQDLTRGMQDFKAFQEKLRSIALSVSHNNHYMLDLDTIGDEDTDDWIIGLQERAREEDSCRI
jgi:hypothetical protein